MNMTEEKLSFSLPSKPKIPSSSTPHHTFLLHQQPENEDDESPPWPQYITEFDPSKTPTPKPHLLIPPKPNTWNLRIKKYIGNEDPPSTPNSVQDPSLKRLQEDLRNLPDDRGLDEFDDVPVGSFGSALLAGYGWSEGRGIGLNSKGDVKVPQYPRRSGTEGLGFVRELQGSDSNLKHKRVIGCSSDPPAVPSKRVFLGKVVRVVEGRNVGLKGEVVEELGSGFEASSAVVLRILESGEHVRVGMDQFAELGSVEEDQCLRKLQELEIELEDSNDRRLVIGKEDD